MQTSFHKLYVFAGMVVVMGCMGFSIPAAAAAAASAASGVVSFSSGNVVIRSRAGVERPGTTGALVEIGDTVLTNIGRVQLRFADGGMMSLQPRTEFRIEDYNFADRTNGTEKAVFNLIKGGVRAITGLIGKVNRDTYRLNTLVATIGIRGTTFQALVCAGNCSVPDGLYVKGGEGTIFVQNGFGSIDVSRGQAAYVPNANSPPQQTSTPPRVGAPPAANAVQFANAGSGEFPSGEYLFYALGFNFGPLTRVNVTGGGAAFAATGGSLSFTASASGESPFSFSGSTGQGGIGSGAGSINPADVSVASLLLDGIKVISITALSPSGATATATTTNVENAGTDGNLYWGRWANGRVVASASANGQTAQGAGTLSGTTGMSYVFGLQAATMPTAGNATYSFTGGTPSTSDGGSIGAGVAGGTLNVNFLASTVSVNMTVNHNGTYNLASGAIPMNAGNRAVFSNSVPFTSSGAGAYPTNVSGFFSGANAVPQSAGLAYQIQKPSDFINGVAGFSCRTGC